MVCLVIQNKITDDDTNRNDHVTKEEAPDGHKRFQMIELQGTLEFEKTQPAASGAKHHVGRLSFSTDHVGRPIPVLTIGNQRLEGKVVRLKKPLAIVRSCNNVAVQEETAATTNSFPTTALAKTEVAVTAAVNCTPMKNPSTVIASSTSTPFQPQSITTPSVRPLQQTPQSQFFGNDYNDSSPAYHMSQMTPGLPRSQRLNENFVDYEERLAGRQQMEIIGVIEEKYLFSQRPEHHVPPEALLRR